ncbi:MAG: hypothetical protein J7K23_04735 [Thermoproteales archaeon]|nr:hypothetical protein [Thermoproteales archaeon]
MYNNYSFFNINNSLKAIKIVSQAKPYLYPGPPLLRNGPLSIHHIDIPIMYHSYALDIMHWDPEKQMPSPKGRPVKIKSIKIKKEELQMYVNNILKETWIVNAAEFREPEKAWIIPVAWKNIIILHVKVSYDGTEIIPDYRLTEEIKRYVF